MRRIETNGRDDANKGNDIFMLAVANVCSDEKMFEAVELVVKEINTECGSTASICKLEALVLRAERQYGYCRSLLTFEVVEGRCCSTASRGSPPAF